VLEYLMIVLFAAGVACLATGAWMAWQPAGLLVAGAALVLVPILWVRGGWASSTG
jgi:hypothetical protein